MKTDNKQFIPLTNFRTGQLLFFICWVIYFSTYLGRLNYSAAMADIINKNILSKDLAGMISTSFFLMYGIGQFVNGFLGDKISPFRMIFTGVFISGISNFLMYITTFFISQNKYLCAIIFAVIWGINGYTQSLIWSPIIRIFSNILPEEQRIKACINMASTTAAGTLCSYLMSTLLMITLGWEAVFPVAGIILIVISIIWIIATKPIIKETQRDYLPKDDKLIQNENKNSDVKTLPFFKLVIMSGVIFMMLPVAIMGVLKDGVTSWVPTFITETFFATPAFSVLITTILPIVNLFGAFAAQFINEKWLHDEMKTSAFFFSLSTVSIAFLYFFGSKSIVLTVLCLAITTSSMLAINTMLISLVPLHFGKIGKASSMTGILNSTAYVGAALSTYLIGFFAEKIGWSFTIMLWLILSVVGIATCIFTVSKWSRFKNSDLIK